MALSKAKREAIKEALMNGDRPDDIAEVQGVSRRTVFDIKKELTEENPDAAQIMSECKCIKSQKKREEKYLTKIAKEKILFEDPIEGWIYHMTAEELRSKASSKWWSFIVYPESAPEDWKEKLIALHCELAISPLHDKDVWEHDSVEVVDPDTGEVLEERGARYKSGKRKKAHWHCILKTDTSMSYEKANDLIREITYGPYVQKCMSLKGAYEYFTHMNNPERYQYEKDEIERYNGFVIETTRADRIVMIDEIGRVIAEEKLTDIEEVRAYYEGQYEYIDTLSLKAFYFEKLTQSNFRRAYPEGRIQQVRLIHDKSR